jgi:hypothetical protein
MGGCRMGTAAARAGVTSVLSVADPHSHMNHRVPIMHRDQDSVSGFLAKKEVQQC